MTVDWSSLAETVVEAGLAEIPEVGGLLSGLVGVFWPKSKEDVWGEVRTQTEQLINQKLAENDYNRVSAVLGDADQDTGLIGVLNNYNGAEDGQNDQDPKMTWISANDEFIDNASAFQQKGDEVLLLPLFAQMVNLHLALLRRGVAKGYTNGPTMTARTENYERWAKQWMAQAITDARKNGKNQYSATNNVARFMQINVGNHCRNWLYFNPQFYPQPVSNIQILPEIFYTVRDPLGQPTTQNYSPPGSRAGYISQVDVYTLLHNPWIMLIGCNVFYDSNAGSTNYTGVPKNATDGPGVAPPINKNIYGYGTASLTSTSVNSSNKIQRIDGNLSADNYIRYIQFTFQDNTYTKDIPYSVDSVHDGNWNFSIIPPSGYFMSSMWVPSDWGFYQSAQNAIFGWQKGVRPDRSQLVGYDSQEWAETVPWGNSQKWVQGYSVQYTTAWIYSDGTVSNLLPWCDPMTGPWALPLLWLPISPDPKVVGRKVCRKFEGWAPEWLPDIKDNTTVTYRDETL